MITNEIIKELYKYTVNKKDSFWGLEFKPSDIQWKYEFFRIFESEVEISYKDIEQLKLIGNAVISDLIRCWSIVPDNAKIELQFLQFYFSSILADIFISRKVFFYGFDWLCNSLSDEVFSEVKCDSDIDRIRVFYISSSSFINEHFEECLTLWLSNLYYYSLCTGGHYPLASAFLDSFLGILEQLASVSSINKKLILASCQMCFWAEKHKLSQHTERISKLLQYYYHSPVVPHEDKKTIVFLFSSLRNSYTKTTRIHWLRVLEQEYNELLNPIEKLQLVLNKTQGDHLSIIFNLDDINDRITDLRQFISEIHEKSILVKYELNRLYKLITTTLVTLLKNRKYRETTLLIQNFMGATDEEFDKKVLFIIPNSEEGVLYCSERDVIISNSNSFIKEITRAGNEFLGTTNFLDDDLSFDVQAPERFGVPDPKYAKAYYTLLQKHFDFHSFKHIPNLDIYKSFYLFFGHMLPIQSIIAAEQYITLPVEISFQNLLPPRNIKKVCIWQSDAFTSEIESLGVKEIFESCGIVVDIMYPHETDMKEFNARYSDDSYDLMWISGHGEFIHFEPHKSFLPLSDGLSLDVVALENLKLSISDRRLLVMNVCNGATSSLFNGPGSIGLGESLVSKHQSIISHLWPVDFMASVIYVFVLATYLAEGYSYEDSYMNAVHTFQTGKGAVMCRIKCYLTNDYILERVSNKDFDYDNFFYWGSLNLSV